MHCLHAYLVDLTGPYIDDPKEYAFEQTECCRGKVFDWRDEGTGRYIRHPDILYSRDDFALVFSDLHC